MCSRKSQLEKNSSPFRKEGCGLLSPFPKLLAAFSLLYNFQLRGVLLSLLFFGVCVWWGFFFLVVVFVFCFVIVAVLKAPLLFRMV